MDISFPFVLCLQMFTRVACKKREETGYAERLTDEGLILASGLPV